MKKIASDSVFQFKNMKIGDSFPVSTKGYKNLGSLRARLYQEVKKFNEERVRKFEFKSTKTKNGIKVWRVK